MMIDRVLTSERDSKLHFRICTLDLPFGSALEREICRHFAEFFKITLIFGSWTITEPTFYISYEI